MDPERLKDRLERHDLMMTVPMALAGAVRATLLQSAGPTPVAGAVLVEGAHGCGDGHRPLAAQAAVEEAVLRGGLLG
jgi:hypothetical protein